MMKMTMMIEQSMKEKMMLSGTGISFFSTMLSWYVVNNSTSIRRCVVPLATMAKCYHESGFDF